jgi:hypothetical protein
MEWDLRFDDEQIGKKERKVLKIVSFNRLYKVKFFNFNFIFSFHVTMRNSLIGSEEINFISMLFCSFIHFKTNFKLQQWVKILWESVFYIKRLKKISVGYFFRPIQYPLHKIVICHWSCILYYRSLPHQTSVLCCSCGWVYHESAFNVQHMPKQSLSCVFRWAQHFFKVFFCTLFYFTQYTNRSFLLRFKNKLVMQDCSIERELFAQKRRKRIKKSKEFPREKNLPFKLTLIL